MTLSENLDKLARTRARAVRSLRNSNARLESAERARDDTAGTPLERDSATRMSEASAAVVTGEQWLHWVDNGESKKPEADGEWAPQSEGAESLHRH